MEGTFCKIPHPTPPLYISLNFLTLQDTHPQGNSNPFCEREYGYFLEQHTIQ